MPSGARKRKAAKRKKETAAISVDAPFGSHDPESLGRDEDDRIGHDERDCGNGNPTPPSSRAGQLAQDEKDLSVEIDATLDVRVERVQSLGEEADDGTMSGTDSEDHSLYVNFPMERTSEVGLTSVSKSDANLITQGLVPQKSDAPEHESTMNSLLKKDDENGVPSVGKVKDNQTEDIGLSVNHDGAINQKVLTPFSVKETSWKSCCGLFELVCGFHK